MCRFALALALEGEAAAAIRLLGCAEAGFEEIEVDEERWVVRMNDRTRELVRAMIDEAAAAAEAEEGRRLTVDQAVTLALDALRST